MAREVGRRPEQIETMRAADSDRHQVAEQLKAALDEGRLSLAEYDDRVREAYAARTYAELLVLVDDLPRAGMSAADVNAQRAAELKREARRMPMALMVLWTIWGAVTAVNVMVWFIVAATTGFDLYLWPVWLLVPGAALAAVTVGVQSIRQRRQEQ
ncbi:MAG TPA: DUF1707 domain-containing protein [Actinoplanes sp.]|jgi:hypothetical protein|nr:DUF1707 domain-containing protein [Actinoplanes sp.]